MAKRTKKVGASGKYGARYGVRVRKRLNKIETDKSKRYSFPRVSRERSLPQHKPSKKNPRRKARMYKCARCQEPILTSLNTVGIQCKKCGSKVFYKERPNVKKIVRAR
jgi:DNA-directed RNA polymerase subunit P